MSSALPSRSESARPLDGRVPFELGLHGGGGQFPFGRFLVGVGLGDPGLAGDGGGVRGGQVADVPGGVLDLLGHPVAFPDDLLDGEAADDRPQVPGEHPADEHLHPVLLGQEPARRVRDRGLVVPHLERGHRADVQPDALAGDALLGDLRLAQREREQPGLLLHRRHETAMAGDDAELRPLALPERASTTTTRRCRAMGSSDQAANASVPPRTGTSTSPGPPAGTDTVTRPTLPIRLSCPPPDTSPIFRPPAFCSRADNRYTPEPFVSRLPRLSHMTQPDTPVMILAVAIAIDLAKGGRLLMESSADEYIGRLRECIYIRIRRPARH
jgi:hypothetical protein